MKTKTTNLVTSGDIAEALDRDAGRVRHVLDTRRDIRPVGRAGIVRVYTRDVIKRVRSELEAIDQRRRTPTAG
jgi:hypothetical protein